ncbi:MAG: hypothetical protein LGB01_05620 [Sulfurovum sp.]|nr:hypothetical protein [Sulfurovum sp.]
MNQTQKRLNIISLAISIGDTETIQLQTQKLYLLKSDKKIQRIIKELQAKNYAQTQTLISDYNETSHKEIHQRISDLESTDEEDTDISIQDTVDKEDSDILRQATVKETDTDELLPKTIHSLDSIENLLKDGEKIIAVSAKQKEEEETDKNYEAIPYIEQKLEDMIAQYPPIEVSQEYYPSANTWLLKISNEGYTEKEIEEVITYIGDLARTDRKEEAAQLLLISAATHSKFAQLMLARSLFKGDILQQNLSEAFVLINHLAIDDDYGEAMCDLGQMYEYGIGIEKDKKQAEILYNKAMKLGIERAYPHYTRLHKANKGFLSKLF